MYNICNARVTKKHSLEMYIYIYIYTRIYIYIFIRFRCTRATRTGEGLGKMGGQQNHSSKIAPTVGWSDN